MFICGVSFVFTSKDAIISDNQTVYTNNDASSSEIEPYGNKRRLAKEDGAVAEIQKEWYPGRDKHFFFGEQRYYFPEKFDHVTGIGCHILWSEYRGGEEYSAYVFSEDLTEEQKDAAREYIANMETEDTRQAY